MNPKEMINQMAKMFNFKSDKLDENIDKAINMAKGDNPLANIPPEFLQKIKKNINNPIYIPLFTMAGIDRKECIKYIDDQLLKKTNNPTTNNSDKYNKGLKYFD